MKDSKLARQAKDQTLNKTKASRKRKRTAYDASFDESADVEADATVEPEPPTKNKKRSENRIVSVRNCLGQAANFKGAVSTALPRSYYR